jgi:hypothetical protein
MASNAGQILARKLGHMTDQRKRSELDRILFRLKENGHLLNSIFRMMKEHDFPLVWKHKRDNLATKFSMQDKIWTKTRRES